MKKLIAIVIIASLVACGKTDDPKAIKGKIKEYKEQISGLEEKIDKLEKTLEEKGVETKDLKKVNVKSLVLTPSRFVHYVEASASLEAIKSAFISPEINGQVQTVHVQEGNYVRKGQLLVSLNSDIIQSSIKELETSLELAKTIFAKQEELWSQKIGSEIQYLESKNNKEALESKLNSLYIQRDKSRIKAPISGIVDEISVKKGELAMPGAQIIQMVNISNFYVNADVSEKFIASIKKNSPLIVSFPTFPDWKIDTKVYRIGNIIKQANRTFTLQAKINNKDNKLKPNMLAVVKFQDFEMDEALVVPSIIIKEDFKGKYLYIVESNSAPVAKKIYVKTSLSNDEGTMITEGLNMGDKVIVEGYNLIKDGIAVEER
ncbi:MAG: efflux RND transporter periplasmic adaptor subunit [Bacteroidota bacterium]